MSEEMAAISVCKYMGGWDLQTYDAQPDWFIELILGRMDVEGRIDAARNKARR